MLKFKDFFDAMFNEDEVPEIQIDNPNIEDEGYKPYTKDTQIGEKVFTYVMETENGMYVLGKNRAEVIEELQQYHDNAEDKDWAKDASILKVYGELESVTPDGQYFVSSEVHQNIPLQYENGRLFVEPPPEQIFKQQEEEELRKKEPIEIKSEPLTDEDYKMPEHMNFVQMTKEDRDRADKLLDKNIAEINARWDKMEGKTEMETQLEKNWEQDIKTTDKDSSSTINKPDGIYHADLQEENTTDQEMTTDDDYTIDLDTETEPDLDTTPNVADNDAELDIDVADADIGSDGDGGGHDGPSI